MFLAPPLPFGQRWLEWGPHPRLVLVHLRLAGVQQGEQTGIVRVGGFVDQDVHQVVEDDWATVGETRPIAGYRATRPGRSGLTRSG